MQAHPDDVLDALEAHPDPVVTAPELADDLEVTSRTVLDRLNQLQYAGKVERKEVGARCVVWWSTQTTPHSAADRQPEQDPVKQATVEPVNHDLGDDLDEQIDEIVSDLDLPGSGPALEARRNAVGACIDYIRDRGESQRSAFTEDIYPENPAHYQSKQGWWNTIGKDGLQTVATELDDLEAPGEGEHIWTWREN